MNLLAWAVLFCSCPGVAAPAPPTALRIVALAPSAAEWVADFGVDLQQVVGVSEYTDFPEALKSRPTVGPYNKINLEKVFSLKPTLVVATRDGNIKDQVDRIRAWGIPTVLLDGTSMASIRQSITTLGEALQLQEKAKQMTKAWDQELANLSRRHPRLSQANSKEPALIYVQLSQNPWITVGKDSFIREGIELAGASNFGTAVNGSYPKVQFEKILLADPDWVLVPLLSDTADHRADVYSFWNKFPALKAVKSHQVCVVTWNEIMRPVRRFLVGVEKLATLLSEKKSPGAYCGP